MDCFASLAMTDGETYPFASFAFSAYNASSASRGDISSGCSAFTASTSSSASLGGAGSAAAREGTANKGRSSARAKSVLAKLEAQDRFGAGDHGGREAG